MRLGGASTPSERDPEVRALLGLYILALLVTLVATLIGLASRASASAWIDVSLLALVILGGCGSGPEGPRAHRAGVSAALGDRLRGWVM